ncbi:MAG TPA: hypothetical protein VGE74_12840 [Gemmata sp.]
MDALLSRMTAAQITGWAAFAEIEPFGPLREDQRAAHAACVVANSIPFRGKGAKALQPADIFASLAKPARKQTASEMAGFAKAQTLAMGGEVRTIQGPTQADLNERKKRRPGNRDRR